MAAKKKRILVDVTAAGRLGGAARAANLSEEQRQEASRQAVKARWEKYYRDHPDKLKAKLERESKKRKAKRGRPPK
jgi:hypothetical protein